MIIDVSGVVLIPGNDGVDCPGNGKHVDENDNCIECCCDECDYLICCTAEWWQELCKTCKDIECPRISGLSVIRRGFSLEN